MNFWSAVSVGKIITLVLVLSLLPLMALVLLYLNRGKVFLWLLESGTLTADYLLRRLLETAGVTNPQWVLVEEEGDCFSLGLVISATMKNTAVFLPSTPTLIPGKMLFVPKNAIKPLENLTLKEGIEVLLSFGPEIKLKLLDKILWHLE